MIATCIVTRQKQPISRGRYISIFVALFLLELTIRIGVVQSRRRGYGKVTAFECCDVIHRDVLAQAGHGAQVSKVCAKQQNTLYTAAAPELTADDAQSAGFGRKFFDSLPQPGMNARA